MDSLILVGAFDEKTGRPFLKATLYLPRLRLQLDIDFLVDTGADITTLSPNDGHEMGLDYDALTQISVPSIGVGGISERYVEQAVVMFDDVDRMVCMYSIDLDILEPQPHIERLPSLLGRDILHRMQIHYSYPTNSLTFQIETADRIIPLPS